MNIFFTIILFLISLCFGSIKIFQNNFKISRNSKNWNKIDEILNHHINNKAFPGCVAVIGDKNGVLFLKSFGNFKYDLNSKKMGFDTLFDMASVTKVLATTMSIAQFYERGEVTLLEKVSDFFPDFAQNGKKQITLTNLLLHNAGFPPDPTPYWFYQKQFGCSQSKQYYPKLSFSCQQKIFKAILTQKLINPIGEKYVYSDISMMTMMYVVGFLAKKHGYVTVDDLNKECSYQYQNINNNNNNNNKNDFDERAKLQCYYEGYVRKMYSKLNLMNTKFIPKQNEYQNCAPAWIDKDYRHQLIQGSVSDQNCYASGGIQGHAGLFSNIIDVNTILRAILFQEKPLLTKKTVDFFRKARNTTQSERALGFDTMANGIGSCGTLSRETFLHLGYTGTQVCLDPIRGLYTSLLTNRVYPETDNLKIRQARKDFNSEVQKIFDQYYYQH